MVSELDYQPSDPGLNSGKSKGKKNFVYGNETLLSGFNSFLDGTIPGNPPTWK